MLNDTSKLLEPSSDEQILVKILEAVGPLTRAELKHLAQKYSRTFYSDRACGQVILSSIEKGLLRKDHRGYHVTSLGQSYIKVDL